nr:hypothetical protein [Nostoc sp. ChiSLP03a]MDZ8212707.1 hypothetical protein [Nostoc sp. ChiSLP03a]
MLSLKAHEPSPRLDSLSENAQGRVLMMLLNVIATGKGGYAIAKSLAK